MKAFFNKFLLLITFFISTAIAESGIYTLETQDLLELSLTELLDVEIDSASKISLPLKKIPASVSIVTRSEIEKYGYVNLAEILKNIPGLYIMDNTESLIVGVRGSAGGGLQFLVNGVPLHPSLQKGLTSTSRNKFNIPVNAIDRIEVIRGPMSVMYGNNSFFGVINIVTNDVKNSNGLASLSYGSRDSSEVFARYSQHNKDGYFVINAGANRTDGIYGDYNDILSTSQLSSLHPGVGSDINGQLDQKNGSVDSSFGYKDFVFDFSFRKMNYGFYPTTPGFDTGNHINLKTYQGSLSYTTDLSDTTELKLLGILSEEKYKIGEFSFIDPSFGGNQKQESRRNEFELNLVNTQDSFQVLFGYRYVLINNLSNDSYVDFSTAAQSADSNIDDVSTNELFSQISYEFDENFNLIFGLRYLRRPDNYNRNVLDTITGNTRNDRVYVSDRNQVTGRIALIYSLSQNQSFKFLVGTARKDNQEFQITDPEEILTYEINHLLTYDDFQLSTSIFYNEIDKIAQRNLVVNNGTTTSIVDNKGKWKTYGTEIIASYYINDSWQAHASATLQKTTDSYYNSDVGYSPKILAKIRTDYTHKNFIYSLNSHFVSSMASGYTFSNTFPYNREHIGEKADAYVLVGANIRYKHASGVYANLNISNLFDEDYHYATNEITTMEKGLEGMGRVITGTIGYKF